MRKLLLIAIFACIAFSCEDEVYSTIPWAPVNFKLHLNGEDFSLNSFGYKIFMKGSVRHAGDQFGYGGILVVNTQKNGIVDLRAYDLSCPNEAAPDVIISPDNSGLEATCPKCGAKYSIISDGGGAISGSKHWLKQYNVSIAPGISGTYMVTN